MSTRLAHATEGVDLPVGAVDSSRRCPPLPRGTGNQRRAVPPAQGAGGSRVVRCASGVGTRCSSDLPWRR
eukprot:16438372-Heterocapsa_arctica.AAC.1